MAASNLKLKKDVDYSSSSAAAYLPQIRSESALNNPFVNYRAGLPT